MVIFQRLMICVFVLILTFAVTIGADTISIEHKGQYENLNYLYSFTIPEGFTCIGDPPPSPNHGCRIYLSKSPESYIWISGDYNSSESLSPADELIRRVGPLLKEGTEISVIRRKPFVLCGLSGERLTISFACLNAPKLVTPMVRDTVVAFRTVEGHGEMIYTVGLVTPIPRYKEDQKILELILSTWANQPKK